MNAVLPERPAAADAAEPAARAGRGADTAEPWALLLTPGRLFVVLGLIAIVAIAAVRADALLAERRNVLQQRQAQAATLAQFAATYSSRLYDQSAALADTVAERLNGPELTGAELHRYLDERAGDTTANDYIVVLDAKGVVRATSESAAPPPTAYGSPDFARRWSGTERRVLPVMRSRLSGSVIYSLSRGLHDSSGAFTGVVGVNVRPDGIRPTAARRPQDPLLTVWGQDGTFIAASFVDFDAQGQPIPPEKPSGLGIPGSANQVAPLTASSPVAGWPLIAVASFDTRGVLAEWRQHVYETIAVLLLSALGIGALVFLGVRTAGRERQVRQALESANAVAAEAIRQRELLLKEVHHRVKNSLAMTASLIHLQERRFNDPEVREAFESTRRRLTSISLVHEALYSGSSLHEVDLAGYLTALSAEIAEAYGAAARDIRLKTDMETVPLMPQQATPVGLIVTEVLTNAFKHAFGPDGSGEILLRVRRNRLDDVEVEIRDNGQGYPAEGKPDREGLGTRVIAALTDQLRGHVTRETQGGAVFRLTFPRSAG
ncbi:sensor histidine kinase [Phenylobacterium sp.]|jgi:two-component sensor histidine kinase|uniref:sensor histidine kinase n=1 Tax=Phenylobacterium sp. TaxID=1871053 RepID=UPI002F958A90